MRAVVQGVNYKRGFVAYETDDYDYGWLEILDTIDLEIDDDFLKGNKNLSRDKLIIVCIMLKLNLQESRNILKRLIQADFYPKNERDFEIMCGIRQRKSLYDINEILLAKDLTPLN